ncbi:MAG: hypothetical protein LBD23_18910 [Oscillospiraceae bacterium]|jgi:hypothetical protein|nr:hypothetical protein [Oscillospiraceae bacterium]
MKRNENEKIETKTEQTKKTQEKSVIKSLDSAEDSYSLAALHGSLLMGTLPELPAEQTVEAAGALGNQNILKLMEKSADLQQTLSGTGMHVDTQVLAQTLSGPPSGPINAMETFI